MAKVELKSFFFVDNGGKSMIESSRFKIFGQYSLATDIFSFT